MLFYHIYYFSHLRLQTHQYSKQDVLQPILLKFGNILKPALKTVKQPGLTKPTQKKLG